MNYGPNSIKPSEYFKCKILGTITCKLNIQYFDEESNSFKNILSDTDKYDVIRIEETDKGKIYHCDHWNAPNKVQVVHEMCVIEFIPKFD